MAGAQGCTTAGGKGCTTAGFKGCAPPTVTCGGCSSVSTTLTLSLTGITLCPGCIPFVPLATLSDTSISGSTDGTYTLSYVGNDFSGNCIFIGTFTGLMTLNMYTSTNGSCSGSMFQVTTTIMRVTISSTGITIQVYNNIFAPVFTYSGAGGCHGGASLANAQTLCVDGSLGTGGTATVTL